MRKATKILMVFLLLWSCSDGPCFKGKGDSTVSSRDLSGQIDYISLHDNLPLTIHLDSANFLRIEGGENVLDYITSEIVDGELILRNENKCGFLRKFDSELKLDLHINSFSALHYFGYGNVILKDTLVAANFLLKSSSGAGDIRLPLRISESLTISIVDGFSEISLFGSSAEMTVYNAGTGWLKAREHACGRINITNSSSGDCIVHADSLLNYSILGIGNIRYSGEPELKPYENTGSGRIIKE